MSRPSLLSRLKLRLAGLPRSLGELDRGIQLWAAFRRLGWFSRSSAGFRSGTGEPIPWWTYGAILWLDGYLRVAAVERCLEFGSGSSTRWLARHFTTVTSVEHDPVWLERVSRSLPAQVDLRRGPTDVEGYIAAVEEGDWDLVVIDGLHRQACLRRASERLASRGLILLDDSDRPAYQQVLAEMSIAGWWRMDFFGFSPGVPHLTCSSVLGREWQPESITPLPCFGHDLDTFRPL